MLRRNSKSKKPKDRFDEVIDAVGKVDRKVDKLDRKVGDLDRKTGLEFDNLKHQMSLVAEQVAHNTEQISKLSEVVELMRYELKLKADNVELISLSRRVTMLERKLINRK